MGLIPAFAFTTGARKSEPNAEHRADGAAVLAAITGAQSSPLVSNGVYSILCGNAQSPGPVVRLTSTGSHKGRG